MIHRALTVSNVRRSNTYVYSKMGQSASYTAKAKKEQNEQQTAATAKGHWVADAKTGFRWATDPIISGPEVVKKPLGNTVPGFENDNNLIMRFSLPNLPGEVWGPYNKKFTKSDIMPGQVFTPPESIDGVPLLCRCRDIADYMRDERGGRMVQGLGAVTMGKNVPACWDDTQSVWNPHGGMKFYVMTRHPDFYAYAASKNGIFGATKAIITGPVGPVPLALGAYFLTRPKTGGATHRRRKTQGKSTRKVNRLKSKRR